MAAKTKHPGKRQCAFCRRFFPGDKRRTYCSVACRESIIRSSPEYTKWAGFYVPAGELPHLEEIHAVSEPNRGGKRTAACGFYGRFIAGLSGDLEPFALEADAVCWRCREAHRAWPDPAFATTSVGA